MAVSNVDGQIKGAVGRDVVVQAIDVAKQGGATARDDGRNAFESGHRCYCCITHEFRPFDAKDAPLISHVESLKAAQTASRESTL